MSKIQDGDHIQQARTTSQRELRSILRAATMMAVDAYELRASVGWYVEWRKRVKGARSMNLSDFTTEEWENYLDDYSIGTDFQILLMMPNRRSQ